MKSFVHRLNNKNLLLAVLFLLTPICVGAIYYAKNFDNPKYVKFNSPDGSKGWMDTAVFAENKLLNINSGEYENLPLKRAEYTLLILVSAGDCPNCLAEREIWKELENTFGREKLSIVGVIDRTSPAEAKTFVKGFELSFPLFLDDKNFLSQATQMPQVTPFKVLLKEGKAIYSEGPNANVSYQKLFGERVKKIINGSQK